MNPRKTQPISIPANPTTPKPSKNLKDVDTKLLSLTLNVRELTDALRASVSNQEKQRQVQEELSIAQTNLANSQNELTGDLREIISIYKATSGFWKVTEFLGKLFKVLLAIAAGAGTVWLFIKGGPAAVQNSDLLK